MDPAKTIFVTVSYIGQQPFQEEVRGKPIYHDIKLATTRAFGLEPSSASKYVLQYQGTDPPDKSHVDSLGQEKLSLHLLLKDEPVKGRRAATAAQSHPYSECQ